MTAITTSVTGQLKGGAKIYLLVAVLFSLLAALFFLPQNAAGLERGALVEKRYNLARARYHELGFSKKIAGQRESWLKCAKAFNRAYKTDPYHPLAPASLLTLGHLYFQTYT